MINLTSVRIGFLSKTDWNVKPLLFLCHSLKQDGESPIFLLLVDQAKRQEYISPEFRR
jgi:hypothetical protein